MIKSAKEVPSQQRQLVTEFDIKAAPWWDGRYLRQPKTKSVQPAPETPLSPSVKESSKNKIPRESIQATLQDETPAHFVVQSLAHAAPMMANPVPTLPEGAQAAPVSEERQFRCTDDARVRSPWQ